MRTHTAAPASRASRGRIAMLGLPFAVTSLAGPVLVTAAGGTAHAVTAGTERAAPAASGRDVTVTVNTLTGEPINVRADASADSKVVGTRRDGQRVTVVCRKVGDPVSGTYGTSRYWDMISTGGYIADAYLSTGSGTPVVPLCGRAAGEPPHRALAPRIHVGFVSHHR
ncbi:hypothetical protein AB0O34_10755 [Sphaerisporangium sp. NPDC088356]|uniref:hypothetical protein n=1 Tax=Sphaerisporangium sp. NPDC088356 TaxID=3154871 RepID=UPI0034154E30